MEKQAKTISAVWGEARLTTKTLNNCSDAGLMALVGRGDMEALGILYMRHGNLVSSAAMACAPSLPRNEIEDLCQDVFISVSQCARSYSEKGKFKSWLYSVAVRTAKRRNRSIRVRKQLLNSAEGRPIASSGYAPVPEQQTVAKLDLLKAFEGLSDIQRQLLILFEYQGMSGEDIASLLELNLNTVWSHLRRARGYVLSVMEDSGVRLQKNEAIK